MRNDVPALGSKLGSFFKAPRSFHSDPPNLTGRRRIYCGRCKRKWIMVHPEDLLWEVYDKHQWFCEDCLRIRTKEKYAADVTVPCSTCRDHRIRIHPDDLPRYLESGWTCPDCAMKGVVT